MWSYQLGGPRRLVALDIPRPAEDVLAEGKVMLRFLAGGICGSDLFQYRRGGAPNGAEPYGRSLHEIVGEVVASRCDLEVGERVVGWVDGNRGLCEYAVTTGSHVIPVASTLAHWEGVPIQPLASVLYGLSRLRRIEGLSVAVIGLGSIGVLFTHVLKSFGAAHVTGIDVIDRTNIAHLFGIDDLYHASSGIWSRELSEGDRPHVVIEAVGHNGATLNDAIRAVRDSGEVLYFGLPGEDQQAVNLSEFKDKHLSLYAGNTPDDKRRRFLDRAQRYVVDHPSLLRPYVTHMLSVKEAHAAFELACNPLPERVKVVLEGTD